MAGSCDILDLNNKPFNKSDFIRMSNSCLYNNPYRDFSANEFIVGNVSKKLFNDSPTMYLNSNEKLLIGELVGEGDNFLTVLGCGDFALDAVYHGAKDVVTFDINRYQYPMALLRFFALCNMKYNDFWNFFCDPTSDDYLSSSIYKKMKNGLKEDNFISEFWDWVFAHRAIEQENIFNDNEFKKISDMNLNGTLPERWKSVLGVNGKIHQVKFDRMMSNYSFGYISSLIFNMLRTYGCKKSEGSYNFSSGSFEETKERLKKAKVSFIESDISCLKDKLLSSSEFSKYDFCGFKSIYLSNIPEYMSGDNFLCAVTEQLMPLLKDDGVIVYCCQAMSEDILTKSKTIDVLDRKEVLSYTSGTTMLNLAEEINDIEGFQKVRQLYDVSTVSMDTFGGGNGNADTDVYVYIKKGKK